MSEIKKEIKQNADGSYTITDAHSTADLVRWLLTQDDKETILYLLGVEKQEPVAWMDKSGITHKHKHFDDMTPLYKSPPQRQPLTEREIELIDGMIEVQLHHAMQCDRIANRTMADKQKGWDMERVELLQKLKAAHGIKGEAWQHE